MNSLMIGALPSKVVTSVPSRPDESFWKDVFDQAETLGLDLAEASALPPDAASTASTLPRLGVLDGGLPEGGRTALAASEPHSALAGPNPQAAQMSALPGAARLNLPNWHQTPQLPVAAARLQAEKSYGLAPLEPAPTRPSTEPTQAPAAVNATLVTLPNGELKLYLRAAGLNPRQAIEAASLSELPWSPGQAPTISEVVLNGQTIYTRGADAAPSFILTC
ncbi:MAG: hypothetical protein Q7V20_20000 [Aquabacterium sp.]|uniref:hypothetical protein n=1 Tax=Aquabacterium sp. TaxID=1872578 RepID=UPI0027245244|nr:hypothetical protein [Aquabacterium sp.]MDO9005734.1 hypothetical protein [Aquabacterium sp.]